MKQLDSENVQYTSVDIERDSAAAEHVIQVNGGNQTVVFPDGSAATNRSPKDVLSRLKASHERLRHPQDPQRHRAGSGPAGYAAAIYARAGLDGLVERRLSVGDPGRCKPHPDAYRYAADSCGVPLQRSAMLGVHPWDLPGATAVGMTTAWIDRHGTPWPPVCTPPTVPARTLGQVALGLVGR